MYVQNLKVDYTIFKDFLIKVQKIEISWITGTKIKASQRFLRNYVHLGHIHV